MAEITLGSATYRSYASIAAADEYLAADANLYASWAALTATGAKERPLISASRYLESLTWKDDTPSYTDTPDIIAEAAIILAAQVALKPKLLESLGSGENVKRVKAGTAEVEFFVATAGKSLPDRILKILSDMLGVDESGLGSIDAPFDGGDGSDKCPSACEYGLTKPFA